MVRVEVINMQAPSSEAWLESFKLLKLQLVVIFTFAEEVTWLVQFICWEDYTKRWRGVWGGKKQTGIVKDNLQGLFTSPLPLPTPGYLLTECMYSDGIVCINKQLRVLVTLVIWGHGLFTAPIVYE